MSNLLFMESEKLTQAAAKGKQQDSLQRRLALMK
jgi:hypothetical protein